MKTNNELVELDNEDFDELDTDMNHLVDIDESDEFEDSEDEDLSYFIDMDVNQELYF